MAEGRMMQRPFIIFYHIERAGGTSLHHAIRYQYPTFLTLSSPRRSNAPNAVLTERGLRFLLRWVPWATGVGGHHLAPYREYGDIVRQVLGREVREFTFLRHPIARFLSHYSYQRRHFRPGLSLREFVEDRYFANFMTKKLAGEADWRKAFREISRFALVGFTEHFDVSVVLLGKEVLGQHIGVVPHLNRGQEGGPWRVWNSLDGEARRMVEETNAEDLALYEAALKCWQRKMADHGGEIVRASEVPMSGRLRKLLWRMHRIYYGPVELLARRVR